MMKTDGWLMFLGQRSRHLKLDPLCSSQTLEEAAVVPRRKRKCEKYKLLPRTLPHCKALSHGSDVS